MRGILVCFIWCIGYLAAVFLTIGVKDKENRYNSIERAFTKVAFKLMGISINTKGLENIPVNEPRNFCHESPKFFGHKAFDSRLYP